MMLTINLLLSDWYPKLKKNVAVWTLTVEHLTAIGNIWRRKWQPTPVFLPGKFHVQRSLAGYSPWGRKESGTTEQLTHTQVILSNGEKKTKTILSSNED